MNITYIVPRFPAASETFVAEEIYGVREQGHRVSIIALAKPTSDQINIMGSRLRSLISETHYLPKIPIPSALVSSLNKPNVQELNSRLSHEKSLVRRLLRLLRAGSAAAYAKVNRADLIYAHWPRPTEVALLASEMTGIPVGISIHAHEVAHDSSHFEVAFEKIRFASFCNKAAMNYLLDKLPKSVHYKANLVYHGVDLKQFQQISLPPLNNILHVVTAGRLTPTKGFDRLIRSVALARDRGVLIQLTIIGDGAKKDELVALVGNLNLADTVNFLGWVPHESMRQHLSKSHVFALLADNNFHDGLPNVVLEAMAIGRPVIISPLPAATEAVEHCKNGFILSSVNAFEEFVECCSCLLNDHAQLMSWSNSATRSAREKHDRSIQLDHLSDLFNSNI